MILLSVTATKARDYAHTAGRSGLMASFGRMLLALKGSSETVAFKPKGVPDVIWNRHSALIVSREQYRKSRQ